MAEQVNGTVTGSPEISGQLSGAPAVSNYEKLGKKPQINGVELIGNKTFEDLGLDKAFASKQELQEQKTSVDKEIEALQKKFDELVDGNEVAY